LPLHLIRLYVTGREPLLFCPCLHAAVYNCTGPNIIVYRAETIFFLFNRCEGACMAVASLSLLTRLCEHASAYTMCAHMYLLAPVRFTVC
jgi:hypothetical protein